MSRMKLILGTAPMLMLAAIPSAHADGLCDWWPFSLTKLCQAHNGGGAVSVAEPGVLAMLAVSMIALGVFVYLRRRRKTVP
ncbi:MAG: PEP-CTERM sorting domain-containing protein [Steroidobacterales bacterium]